LELDELKQMNAGDLRVKEREAREEIFRLKLKLRTNQLDNPSNYRRARKELARVMTLLRQKSGSVAGAAGAAGPAAAKANDARAS
jgi:large subunit ribosomal protein L29